MTEYISNSTEETIELGRKFSRELKTNDCVILEGELGSGKTHFIKGICKGFNINTDVISPTFSIINVYKGDQNIFHFDFYRIKNIDELYEIGFYEYLDSGGIVLIEWGYLFKEILPNEHILVQLSYISETKRRITIKP